MAAEYDTLSAYRRRLLFTGVRGSEIIVASLNPRDSVEFHDARKVHTPPVSFNDGRRRYLPSPDKRGGLPPERGHPVCPESFASAECHARPPGGRMGLPLAPRPQPARRRGGQEGAPHSPRLHLRRSGEEPH